MSTDLPQCLEDIRQRWMTGAIVTKPALLEAYEAGRMAGMREMANTAVESIPGYSELLDNLAQEAGE